MSTSGPLPPHLAQFVRDQLATGHFQSESEVIQTALSRMAGDAPGDLAWLKHEIDLGMSSRPAAPATRDFWTSLRRRVQTTPDAGHGG